MRKEAVLVRSLMHIESHPKKSGALRGTLRTVAGQTHAARMTKLRICTYNIHKGFSQFNRRMVIHELRERLRHLDPDITFLQEVQGLHLGHARVRLADWPREPQHEFPLRRHAGPQPTAVTPPTITAIMATPSCRACPSSMPPITT